MHATWTPKDWNENVVSNPTLETTKMLINSRIEYSTAEKKNELQLQSNMDVSQTWCWANEAMSYNFPAQTLISGEGNIRSVLGLLGVINFLMTWVMVTWVYL